MDQPTTRTIAAATLGCKVNTYDTDALLSPFINNGYTVVDFENIADVYIINTCAVTNISSRKSRQLIRRARKANPEAIVVAAGCYAQIAPDEVGNIEGVSIVIGTNEAANILEIVEGYQRESGVALHISCVSTSIEYTEAPSESFSAPQESKTRAYLKVQDGCDNFCSYCIIPYARGRARSRELDNAISEAHELTARGYKEVVVAGIHVESYGKDTGSTDLTELLQALHNVDGIERLRMSSVEPILITPEFIALMHRSPKLARHLHLSLQSGCDKTLMAMNRRYSTANYAAAVAELRKNFPDIAITTDIIVGFPGETDEDFAQSLEFVRQQQFSRLHVFQYSPKVGTVAATMPNQISSEAKAERAQRMIALGNQLANNFATQFVNKTLDVLYESEIDTGIYEGYSDNYISVRTQCHHDIRNSIIPTTISHTEGETAYGKTI